jgi:hypothetical protein
MKSRIQDQTWSNILHEVEEASERRRMERLLIKSVLVDCVHKRLDST